MNVIKIALLLLICSINVGTAQKNNADNRFDGYIILADGTRKEGIIEVENIRYPWMYQENVKYFDKALMNGGRIKREQKMECVPGEVIEYGISGKRYLYVSYYIKGEDENNKIKSTIGKIKGEKNTDFFAEVYKDGKVALLKFFIPPTIADDDEEFENKLASHLEKSSTNFDILIARAGEKTKSVDEISFKSFFKDCEFIVSKYEAGRYKIKPGKGVKSLLKSDKVPGSKLEAAAAEIIEDYENKCSK